MPRRPRSVRQVPHPEAPGRGDGQGPQAGIRPPVGADRRFIKGQKYTLLSHWGNLTADGRAALKLLFKANRRLNKAYLLKESFGQLWDYQSPVWARRFFDQWREALRWQRLEPFQQFAQMVDSHWDGIEAYCHEENKVPWASSKASTTRSGPSSGEPTASATRSTFG